MKSSLKSEELKGLRNILRIKMLIQKVRSLSGVDVISRP